MSIGFPIVFEIGIVMNFCFFLNFSSYYLVKAVQLVVVVGWSTFTFLLKRGFPRFFHVTWPKNMPYSSFYHFMIDFRGASRGSKLGQIVKYQKNYFLEFY